MRYLVAICLCIFLSVSVLAQEATLTGMLLYTKGSGPDANIYIYDFDTEQETQLTDTDDSRFHDAHASFSSDATQIVFSRDTSGSGNEYQLHRMDADGENLKEINVVDTSGELREQEHAVWSPDGTRIAFKGGINIYSIAADGTDLLRHVADGNFNSYPDYTSDSQTLIFQANSDGDFHISSVSTTATDAVPDRILDTENTLLQPTFSPDGTRLAYISGQPQQPLTLYVASVTGENAVAITDPKTTRLSNPVFSPDGNFIAYTEQTGTSYNQADIFVVELDSQNAPIGQPRRVTDSGGLNLATDWSIRPQVTITQEKTSFITEHELGNCATGDTTEFDIRFSSEHIQSSTDTTEEVLSVCRSREVTIGAGIKVGPFEGNASTALDKSICDTISNEYSETLNSSSASEISTTIPVRGFTRGIYRIEWSADSIVRTTELSDDTVLSYTIPQSITGGVWLDGPAEGEGCD